MYLENLVLDAVDPRSLGRFWEAALGGERLTDDPDCFETRLSLGEGVALDLCLQRVPAPPSEPLRVHLDLLGGEERDAVVERLVGLGAQHVDLGQHAGAGVPWVVLADPEGNPFCVMEERAAYTGTGPVAALPLDSADPDADAALWSWLTGWDDVAGHAPRSLRHPDRRGPLLELCPEAATAAGAKNRLHLDLRLESGDLADEVERGILERGGRREHPTWESDVPWRMYTDCSGNHFCVLPARD